MPKTDLFQPFQYNTSFNLVRHTHTHTQVILCYSMASRSVR